MKCTHCFIIVSFILFSVQSVGQNHKHNPSSNHGNAFEQLGTILPTANAYRTASGAPGHLYWQQKVDYKIVCTLDEARQTIQGVETITYHNNSPDALTYLWLQLDENQHSRDNNAGFENSSRIAEKNHIQRLDPIVGNTRSEKYGFTIVRIVDTFGKPFAYSVNRTMMRIDLPKTLQPKQKIVFNIEWSYQIPDRSTTENARGGLEYFEKDGNYIFTIAQWYPRLCVYSDFQGWQNHQFTGRGEFALTFGDFDVQIRVPADHAVAASGECVNYGSVLNPTQLVRLENAKKSETEPVEIITLAEATQAEKTKSTSTKTWHFVAKNVRDFAWTASRKFIWDALYTKVEGKKTPVLCMSLYPKEAYHLYRKYSTKVVAHTVRSYSHFTIPYPYPVAQSVEANNGMEYPMICFNYGRTEEDGTYSQSIKYGMISVVIHEVGHNFFPMIINSDERQWSWFDEGLNTFLQFLTEQSFQNDYPSQRGPAYQIVDYMKLPADQLEPIMTNSENIIHFGANAYSKPATALNVLRETVMGRKLFDFAFKEYARRWAFRHPQPADFFRTMEDASAVDLDWFWRGWFYDIKPVDVSLDSVEILTFNPDPINDTSIQPTKVRHKEPYTHLSMYRNKLDKSIKFETQKDTSLLDFYNSYQPWKTVDSVEMIPPKLKLDISQEEKDKYTKGRYFYNLYFSNRGGLVSPIIVEWTYADSTREKEIIDAQVWRHNEKNVIKAFAKSKSVIAIRLDPDRETADIDESNQSWSTIKTNVVEKKSRFLLFKYEKLARGNSGQKNPMQKANNKQ